MARPQVANGGDGLQMWRVTENILNKLSRTAEKGGPPALVLGVELQLNVKNKFVTKCYNGSHSL
jgi:hypothetical protein